MAGAEIAYIDESYDSAVFAMSALIVPTHAWRETFQRLVAYRKHLKAKYGLFTSREFHATDFVAGRGRIAPLPVPKGLRCFIFSELLGILASLPVAVISGAWPRAGRSLNESHVRAFSRIQERLQKRSSEQDSQILVIADEGKEEELRRIARRSKVWNPIGSQFGAWGDGSSWKNIPNDRLIEDPFFKASHQSYFLQAADFVSFALLKSEVVPTAHVAKYGLDKVYVDLAPVCAREASRKDPRRLGIVRT